ncbi:MAG: DinB family protein [Chloroflexota bacterium]|nr:DinB family protein [Chloroflexota bacterium]
MPENGPALTALYSGWERYQRRLVEALAPLSEEQLGLRAAPALRPAWLLGAHIIATRVGWFHGWMAEGDAAIAEFDPWDEDRAPTRTTAELLGGLEATWGMIRGCLDRWRIADLEDPFVRRRGDRDVTHSRQWIIWHVIEHDMHHGGELYLTLGAHGLPTPDM